MSNETETMVEENNENKQITITLKDGSSYQLEKGQSLLTIVKEVPTKDGLPYLCAKVGNDLYGLDFVPSYDCNVDFLNYKNPDGRNAYRRSLTFVLARAVMELYRNARLAIDHSIGNGFYYDLFTDVPVSERILGYIKDKMLEIIAADEPFGKTQMTRAEAISLFKKEGYPEKARLLKNLNTENVGVISCWKYIDLDFGAMVPSTSYLEIFDLKQYAQGFVILFPSNEDPTVPSQPRRQPKIFQAYRESKEWGKILGVNNVGRLNEKIKDGSVSDFIKTSEALHSKKIQAIADEITARKSVRIVLIAGPSSSGKTTFSKRLGTHLKVNGQRPVTLSLDNYFLDRQHTPRDENGDYDFESIYALDLKLFNQHLSELLEGKEVQIPEFDFHTGHRKEETTPMRINEDQVVIVEGIHGLNDELTSSIPAEYKFKIYISALTQLVIDDFNRIPTTDTRLIRRTIRDHKYRGYSAEDTINRWASVRRGEERNIFPFQECADMVFNSAVPYEWAILGPLVEPLFLSIPVESPAYNQAKKILKTISFFTPLDSTEVPPTSLLREFIGGSSFHY